MEENLWVSHPVDAEDQESLAAQTLLVEEDLLMPLDWLNGVGRAAKSYIQLYQNAVFTTSATHQEFSYKNLKYIFIVFFLKKNLATSLKYIVAVIFESSKKY